MTESFVVDSSASLRREHVLLSELHEVASANLKGIYLLPARGRSDVWDGVVFPRSGVLRGGVFQFQIEFSLKYPFEGPPKVRFLLPKLFHPNVSENGELNLSPSFPTWQPFQDKLLHLLKAIQSLLISPTLHPSTHPLVQMYETDHKLYVSKGRECVERSRTEVEKGEEGRGFVFGGVGEEEAEAVLNYLERWRGGKCGGNEGN